ncbi:MAG TPA: DUF59 domain-containing protein [Polyangiaceae bacterium]|jgi:FeS assembly SUF system protein
MTMHDPEYERLKTRRILPVMNQEQENLKSLLLESDGYRPSPPAADITLLRDDIIEALKTVYDPEIPLNIYDLGLIYDLDVDPMGVVHVKMTLTAPGCPVAGSLVREVHEKVRGMSGVQRVKTELVWEPPWDKNLMTDAAKLELGLF